MAAYASSSLVGAIRTKPLMPWMLVAVMVAPTMAMPCSERSFMAARFSLVLGPRPVTATSRSGESLRAISSSTVCFHCVDLLPGLAISRRILGVAARSPWLCRYWAR